MQCKQARQLFDAYLDGELSPPLATELGAHRVQCAECRRALALLEVSEHVLSSDSDSVTLEADFAERLIACMERPHVRWTERAGRRLYVAIPVAAAAMIALAFLGVFDGRRDTEVAGNRVVAVSGETDSVADPGLEGDSRASDDEDAALSELFGRVQHSIEHKRRSVESLQSAVDITLLQPLNLLEQAQEAQRSDPSEPAAAPIKHADPTAPAAEPSDEVEDL